MKTSVFSAVAGLPCSRAVAGCYHLQQKCRQDKQWNKARHLTLLMIMPDKGQRLTHHPVLPTCSSAKIKPFCQHVPLLNRAMQLFECRSADMFPVLSTCSPANKAMALFESLPQDDLERRINGSLRPPAFEKGTEPGC